MLCTPRTFIVMVFFGEILPGRLLSPRGSGNVSTFELSALVDYQYTGSTEQQIYNGSDILARRGPVVRNDSEDRYVAQMVTTIPAYIGQPFSDVTDSLENVTDFIYEYDANESMNQLPPLGEMIPVTFVYVFTLLVGVVGNGLVIFSIGRYRRLQNVTNVFLTSLASADLLLVLLCVPVKLAKWFTFTWTFGSFLCKMVHYMQNVSVICSIMTLTAISLERYYAILYPMKAKYVCTTHRARRVILLLWIASLSFATPIIFGQAHMEVGWRHKAYWCVKQWSKVWYSQLYETGMLFGVFILPLGMMTFAYACICREMWRMTAHRITLRARRIEVPVTRDNASCEDTFSTDSRTNPNCVTTLKQRRARPVKDDAYTRKQVIKMLVTIIVLFAICWGPFLIDNVLVAFGHVDQYHYAHLKPMRQAFSIMAYTNSCINPIVYAFMSKNFRHSFQAAFMSLIRRHPRMGGMVPPRSSSFQTKITFSSLLPGSKRSSFRMDGDVDPRDTMGLNLAGQEVPGKSPSATSGRFLNVDHCNGYHVPHRKLSAPI